MKSTFSGFIAEADDQVLVTEAFNSNPYELTFGKKSAGDIFFTFHDEDDKEFRIQFYTPQGLGKNVRQVFIGTKKGASYLDSQQKFKNPMRVAATMIQATKDFLDTPIGKGIDGFAINFSKKVMDRGIALLPKIIRQSGLKQKLNVMDLKYSPDDSRGYVWVVRKGKDPAVVFDGPKMKGITWDDPDKVGDVPVQVDQAQRDADLQGDIDDLSQHINARPQFQHMTSADMDAHPFRRDVLNNINDAVRKEGIAIPGSSKGYYKFNAGGSFRVYFDKVEGNSRDGLKFYGSVATDKGTIRFESAFDTAQVTAKFLEIIRNNAPAAKPSSGVQQYWKFSTSSDGKWPILSFDDGSNSYMVMGDPKTKNITATRARSITKGTGKTIEIALKKIGGSNPPDDMKKQFMDMLNGPSSVGSSILDLTQPRWLALVKAVYSVPKLTGVTSSSDTKARLYLSDSTVILVHMERLAQSATIDFSYIDNNGKVLASLPDNISKIRNIDIAKPAALPGRIKTNLDKIQEYLKKASPGQVGQVADAKNIVNNLNAQRTSSNDIEWDIREYNGKITAQWQLTFRRNSHEGAFQQYHTDISRANAALNRMELILQNAGYKTQNFIPTLYDMRSRDVVDGYSEYEQYIGGQVSGTK